MHNAYRQLVEKANWSHQHNRSAADITAEDICRARLYCYAFRLHVIGTFHATREAVGSRGRTDGPAAAYRDRAIELLEDLANQSMDPVPEDFRAVISTFYRYHRNVVGVLDSLERDCRASRDPQIPQIAERFRDNIQRITGGNGIHLTQDTEPPPQASFVVPNLGIVIVPLVFRDHHSWNLAYLPDKGQSAPTHWHREGVEIHLGYNPTHGVTVLDGYRTRVDEGYAKPIPPGSEHGWTNTGDEIHHVPFVFGSLKQGGWGVFFDVVPSTRPNDELPMVDRRSEPFEHMVYLERSIAEAEAETSSRHTTLIPHTATDRGGVGGLELNVVRVDAAGYRFRPDDFRAVAVVRGEGIVSIEGLKREVGRHDHFGIPRNMQAAMQQTGSQPLVVLEALIRGPANHDGETA